MPLFQNKYLHWFLIALASLLVGAINFRSGIGADSDNMLVLHNFRTSGEGFVPSRSWGDPLYEAAAKAIYVPLFLRRHHEFDAIYAVQAYNVLWLCISAFCMYACARVLNGGNRLKGLWAGVAFLAFPVIVTNANVVMETMQGLGLALLAIVFFLRFNYSSERKFSFFLMALFAGLATSTRPDYVLLAAALFLACLSPIIKTRKMPEPGILIFIAASLLYLLTAVVPYLFYPGNTALAQDVLWANNALGRNFIRAIMGLAALLGLPVCLFLACLSALNFKRFFSHAANELQKPTWLLSLLCAAFFVPRYLLLPDELEYIIIFVPLLILLLGTYLKPAIFGVFIICAAIPLFVQVHLLRMEMFTYVPEIGISPGAIAQDSYMRQRDLFTTEGIRLQNLDKKVKAMGCKNSWVNLYALDVPGLECIIIPQSQLNFISSERGLFPNIKHTDKRILWYPFFNYDKSWRTFVKLEQPDYINPPVYELDLNTIP
ncbi:MAG: hypothetical protein V4543_05210 [Bacteroidota bacterium]